MASRSHKSFFMPLLCRFSINDTVKPTKLHDSSSSLDPSSPKLSCTGQIKKRSTNNNNNNNDNNTYTKGHHRRSYSLSDSTTAKSSVHSTRYHKLHKFFSSKNLISPAIIDHASINNYTKCATKRSKSCNGRGGIPINKNKYHHMTTSSECDDRDIVRDVVTKELDPPLPVVKCCRRDQEVNVNLCKRRGFEMKTLQIQPIQLTINQNCNNNTGGFSLATSTTTFWRTNQPIR